MVSLNARRLAQRHTDILKKRCCSRKCTASMDAGALADWRVMFCRMAKPDQDFALWDIAKTSCFLDRNCCVPSLSMMTGCSWRIKKFRNIVSKGGAMPPADLRTKVAGVKRQRGNQSADVDQFLNTILDSLRDTAPTHQMVVRSLKQFVR